MLIAQRFVAGEGGDRPISHEMNPANLDNEALEDFACDRSNLPWIVFRAAHRANHIAAIPSRSRALLAALARTVDAQKPYGAIFARRELLTGRALQSMRTFYRSLDDLAQVGLIVRAPQKRHGDAGLFGRAYIHLTEKAAELLGFVEEKNPPVAQTSQSMCAISKASEAVVECDPLLTRPSATVADGGIYKDLFPKNQKRQPGTLPLDLQRLLSLGFHKFLVFKLMREAKQHGKLLTEVVEVTWEHLSMAKRPISYLRSLLRSPVDFGHQLRSHHAKIHERRTRANETKAVDDLVARHVGQVFYDEATIRRFEISADGSEITIRDCREPRSRVSAAGWKPDFAAALRAGLLLCASPSHDAAFAEKCTSVSLVASVVVRTESDPKEVTKLNIKPATTAAISARLQDMKQLLRATCAGVRRDVAAQPNVQS
ncbi:replication protein O [Caballeronia sordidicola]|uniref:Replication protein n=1 Tax=Caballeronia sordidicola TaxID=196367 RepID=A0A226WT99_CABSO|nr:replication protein O [Caballeronia sordidicola]OXC74343.1 Replication protein [Caballeronia sordidicola]